MLSRTDLRKEAKRLVFVLWSRVQPNDDLHRVLIPSIFDDFCDEAFYGRVVDHSIVLPLQLNVSVTQTLQRA